MTRTEHEAIIVAMDHLRSSALTDDDLRKLIPFLEDLSDRLNILGETWKLASNQARRELETLYLIYRARGL